ncbi:hypothetical protein BB559_003823 [Furculomyces boomerangus]|uniref:Homeobox domain-containing protein n=1 Tax=Furculomyces boomerangus TaxID=61424 RepID=A0A2T9YII9_9FUNG|nr:hypothetical protein BB559_003823 [Furculomyces boomerangus]
MSDISHQSINTPRRNSDEFLGSTDLQSNNTSSFESYRQRDSFDSLNRSSNSNQNVKNLTILERRYRKHSNSFKPNLKLSHVDDAAPQFLENTPVGHRHSSDKSEDLVNSEQTLNNNVVSNNYTSFEREQLSSNKEELYHTKNNSSKYTHINSITPSKNNVFTPSAIKSSRRYNYHPYLSPQTQNVNSPSYAKRNDNKYYTSHPNVHQYYQENTNEPRSVHSNTYNIPSKKLIHTPTEYQTHNRRKSNVSYELKNSNTIVPVNEHIPNHPPSANYRQVNTLSEAEYRRNIHHGDYYENLDTSPEYRNHIYRSQSNSSINPNYIKAQDASPGKHEPYNKNVVYDKPVRYQTGYEFQHKHNLYDYPASYQHERRGYGNERPFPSAKIADIDYERKYIHDQEYAGVQRQTFVDPRLENSQTYSRFNQPTQLNSGRTYQSIPNSSHEVDYRGNPLNSRNWNGYRGPVQTPKTGGIRGSMYYPQHSYIGNEYLQSPYRVSESPRYEYGKYEYERAHQPYQYQEGGVFMHMNQRYYTEGGSTPLGSGGIIRAMENLGQPSSVMLTPSLSSSVMGIVGSGGMIYSKRQPLFMSYKQQRRRHNKREIELMEKLYKKNPLPTKEEKLHICELTGMEQKHVQVWFQNRRQSDKKKLLERESAQMEQDKSSSQDITSNTKNITHRSDISVSSSDGENANNYELIRDAHSEHKISHKLNSYDQERVFDNDSLEMNIDQKNKKKNIAALQNDEALTRNTNINCLINPPNIEDESMNRKPHTNTKYLYHNNPNSEKMVIESSISPDSSDISLPQKNNVLSEVDGSDTKSAKSFRSEGMFGKKHQNGLDNNDMIKYGDQNSTRFVSVFKVTKATQSQPNSPGPKNYMKSSQSTKSKYSVEQQSRNFPGNKNGEHIDKSTNPEIENFVQDYTPKTKKFSNYSYKTDPTIKTGFLPKDNDFNNGTKGLAISSNNQDYKVFPNDMNEYTSKQTRISSTEILNNKEMMDVDEPERVMSENPQDFGEYEFVYGHSQQRGKEYYGEQENKEKLSVRSGSGYEDEIKTPTTSYGTKPENKSVYESNFSQEYQERNVVDKPKNIFLGDSRTVEFCSKPNSNVLSAKTLVDSFNYIIEKKSSPSILSQTSTVIKNEFDQKLVPGKIETYSRNNISTASTIENNGENKEDMDFERKDVKLEYNNRNYHTQNKNFEYDYGGLEKDDVVSLPSIRKTFPSEFE